MKAVQSLKAIAQIRFRYAPVKELAEDWLLKLPNSTNADTLQHPLTLQAFTGTYSKPSLFSRLGG